MNETDARYNAALVDELTLEPGMRIVVQEIYDDGWARGVVSAGGDPNQHGRVGQFPTVSLAALSWCGPN